jgi:hypothetical protein
LTVPNLATDFASALIDQVLIEYGETANTLLAINFPFTIKSINTEGSFLLLFDQAASNLIRTKLQAPREEAPHV